MTLIFLHVPKAGGNSFLDFLLPNFPVEQRFDVNKGLNYPKRLAELEHLDEDQKRSIELVYGHLPFGVHRWLPQPCRYITVLRDPIDRVVSHYYFVKEQPAHPLYGQVVDQQMSLAEYAKSGLSGELNNGMTRLICGQEASDSLRGHGPCHDSDLQTAIQHLEQHFEVVGLLESLTATQRLLSKRYQWPMQNPVQRNKTGHRQQVNELSAADRAAISEENELDLQLYRWAQDRFANDCRESNIDPQESPKRRSFWAWISGRPE